MLLLVMEDTLHDCGFVAGSESYAATLYVLVGVCSIVTILWDRRLSLAEV